MRSNNILILGILFILLLITFCTTNFIDQIHPNVKTIPAPNYKIVEQTSIIQKD